MIGTRKARLVRRTLVASIISVAGLVAAAPVAAADPCPPLDLGCVVDDTTTTAGGVVDDTTTTVGDAVDDTTTTVGEVVDDTTTTVGDVVDDTTTTVGDVVDDNTSTVGGVIGGAGQIDPSTILDGVDPSGTLPGGGAVPGPGETPTGGDPTPTNGGGTTHTGTASAGSHDPQAVVGAAGSGGVTPGVGGATSTAVGHPIPASVGGGGGVLVAAARLVRTLAIPLALILLVISFLFVQNRIDRKDPKLALAPVGSEYLTFS